MVNALESRQSAQHLAGIRRWFGSPLGEQVLQTETAILEQLLTSLFGYHLLEVSVQNKSLSEASPIQHKFRLGITSEDDSQFLAKPNDLPLEDDSVDVAVLHHMLDFVDDPQEILRELSRTVRPMGHLVIVGFNPFSLWGLCKPFAGLRNPLSGLRKQAPWNGRFIRPDRLMDWMNLLNFRIDRANYGVYGLPRAAEDWKKPDYSKGLSRNANWPVGGVYIIVARKHVGTMTPIRPVWKPQQKAFGQLSVVRSANRDMLPPGEGPAGK